MLCIWLMFVLYMYVDFMRLIAIKKVAAILIQLNAYCNSSSGHKNTTVLVL